MIEQDEGDKGDGGVNGLKKGTHGAVMSAFLFLMGSAIVDDVLAVVGRWEWDMEGFEQRCRFCWLSNTVPVL